jgi:hypothetical protein
VWFYPARYCRLIFIPAVIAQGFSQQASAGKHWRFGGIQIVVESVAKPHGFEHFAVVLLGAFALIRVAGRQFFSGYKRLVMTLSKQ